MSGRTALDTIQKAIRDEQERTRKLDADLGKANDELLKIDVARSKLLKELARLRLQFLSGSDILTRIDETDRQALALLEKRSSIISGISARLDDYETRRADLEARRAALGDELEAAMRAIDDAEVAVQERLKTDAAYLEQKRVAQESERVAVHADEKATLSEQEQDSKGASYRDDPLFMYLYGRGYGTTSYRARGLTRWLDGKVARLIGYHDARPNYARLLDLPVRLREHAEWVGAQADEEFAKLKVLDEQARSAAGIEGLEKTRDAVSSRIAQVDAEIHAAAEANQQLLLEAETHAKGEDAAFVQAVAFLSSEFSREEVRDLRQQALTTPFPEDDVIVSQVLDLEAEKARHAETVAELKNVAEANRKRLGELEQIRREFTQRQYDVPGSTFSNGNMVAAVIAQLLMGALSKDSFWNVLKQQRRYNPPRTDPTFGSGGFGRGTIWGGSPNVGRDIGGQILGEVLSGLGGVLGEMARSSGRSSSSRGSWGSGGGSFGGTSRARSSSSGSRPSTSRSGSIKRGGFKTGGKF
jgi:hypothetical protein